jgi:hypothetical protein
MEVPKHVANRWSDKQWKAFRTAKRMTYYVPSFVDSAIGITLKDTRVGDGARWRRKRLPNKISHYVCQAYRAYTAKCYDGCIVMLARVIEYSLKEVLKNKVTLSPRATLGELIRLYENRIGKDKVVQKIIEVQNMERIICAHDIDPYEKIMDVRDADHAWTAIEIVLRDLLAQDDDKHVMRVHMDDSGFD